MNVPNDTCSCISGGDNFAMIYAAPESWFVDSSIDFTQATRIQQWLDTAEPWWNGLFEWAGKPDKFAGGGGSYTIYVRDLSSIAPGVMMRFTNDVTGQIRIEVDPTAFDYGDDLDTTWMAHELGHAIGVAGHSACDQNSSLMAAVIDTPQNGITKDAEYCWIFSEYADFRPVCTHFG